MDTIDYANLIHIVETSTKRYQNEVEYHDKPSENVANLGATIGDVAKLERNGEYYGIAVEFLEDVPRLLTDKYVIRLLRLLKKEDYITVMNLLNLTSTDQIFYVLHTWFMIATTTYDNSLDISKKTYSQYDDWIKTVRSDPLPGRIRVIEVGQNQTTGDSVIPVEWLNREFDNAIQMHSEMDKLVTRIGKPPVTYAVIYSMIKQNKNTIVKDISGLKYSHLFGLDLINGKIKSTIDAKPNKKYTYVVYGKTIVGFVMNDILESKDTDNNMIRGVGALVSRLQKSIRRGGFSRSVLEDTVDEINRCPNYNLPEHGFMRVSASKQLVWRLFISILEDCRPYKAESELSLLDIMLLVLITNKCLEYRFTKPVMCAIKHTAILAQYNDLPEDLFDWRKYNEATKTPINPKSSYHTAISLAIKNIIMMAGDTKMLKKLYSAKDIFLPFDIPEKKYHDQSICDDVTLSSIDHHCAPYIILYYQACIPKSLSTKEISSYIWNNSSSYNIRSGLEMSKRDPVLRSIQSYIFKKISYEKPIKITSEIPVTIQHVEPNDAIKRSSFLILFGKKYRYAGHDVVLTGSIKLPIRIKIDNTWKYSDEIKIMDAYPRHTIDLSKLDPPFGFKWNTNKITVSIVNGCPMVNDMKIPFFDGSKLLASNTPIVKLRIGAELYKTVMGIISGSKLDFDDIIKLKNTNHTGSLFNWLPNDTDSEKVDIDLIKLVYIKIFNQFDNIVTVGPVDRYGHKMANAINYILEGRIWAMFNLLSYIYPDTIKPQGTLNFQIKKTTSSYVHMVHTLETIIYNHRKIIVKTQSHIPKILTPLWIHQKRSVDKIMVGFNKGCHGRGDASDVGSGKTLTSIGVAVELINAHDPIYSGILVMLPGNKLIATWKDELNKHTSGFDIKFQQNNADIGPIKQNTIVITTMGKMRDHPISHHWLLVIIDECLSVQNKNALQTEEAWKQSMLSKHLLLMSATFFRTRFDKLYYMLKMLQTGLPENKEYLDCILLETIVSKVANLKRNWTSNINYFELDSISRKEYDKIASKDISVEAKYSKLNSYLISSPTATTHVLKQLRKLIKKLESKKHRCLIYARSKDEATEWSQGLGIDIYPIKGQHTIITYNDGTYGLNDLVIYDTIVLRPLMTPDKIDQIKGRLDRPGQESLNLNMEYFIVKDTIEEGLLIRMNMCSQFVKNHILPLSKFYDISVNYEKYA